MPTKMLANYQACVDTVVGVFRAKYRLSAAEADDLESEILVRLCTIHADPRFAAMLDHGPWLKTVVNNAARDYLRRLQKQRARMRELHECADVADDAGESLMVVWELLESLSTRQRKAIRLWFGLDGLTPCHDRRKIAKLLGITRGQTQQLIDSAFARMRRHAGTV